MRERVLAWEPEYVGRKPQAVRLYRFVRHVPAYPGAPLACAVERHGPGGPAGLQTSCGRATHGSVGSTPAPLRFDNRYLQSFVPGSSEKVPPPPTVTGVFHGKQPSFCAVAATRRMSPNTPAIASAIKNFLMHGL